MILCVCPNPSIDKLIYMDDFDSGKVNRINEESFYPGGKGVHVALAIRELGEEVTLLSIWGGETGKWVKQECEAKGIVCYGPEVEGWTRTCLTIKAKNNFNETELLGTGPMIGALECIAFFKEYEMLIKKSDIVSMSGSWPKNVVDANYSQLIEKATQLNIKSFIDCSGSLLINALEKKTYTIHLNHNEGYEIYKSYNPLDISLKLASHCNISVISYGDKGLYLYDGKNLIHALCKVDNVISTVGSGDCLMAGLIVAYKRNYNSVKMAKLAAASGAANCIRKDLGMFYKKDVEKLLESCIVNVNQLNKENKDGKKI